MKHRQVKYFMAGDYQKLVTSINMFLDKDGSILVDIIPLPERELSCSVGICQALVIVEDTL